MGLAEVEPGCCHSDQRWRKPWIQGKEEEEDTKVYIQYAILASDSLSIILNAGIGF